MSTPPETLRRPDLVIWVGLLIALGASYVEEAFLLQAIREMRAYNAGLMYLEERQVRADGKARRALLRDKLRTSRPVA